MAKTPRAGKIDLDDYTAIEQAVMETARGRWFLAEYAARNRQADTQIILEAVTRLEKQMAPACQPVEVDQIRFDLVEMATAIARTKAEIAAMKPDVDHAGAFSSATAHLDIIVAQTEAATSDILAAAEQIQEIAWTMREHGVDGEVCDILDGKATDIYTACSFQDLTGQRTRKVLDVLQYLEDRLSAIVGIWGLEGAAGQALPQDTDHQLLNGPALPGEGLAQADVDTMMVPPDAAYSAAGLNDAPALETPASDASNAEAASDTGMLAAEPVVLPPAPDEYACSDDTEPELDAPDPAADFALEPAEDFEAPTLAEEPEFAAPEALDSILLEDPDPPPATGGQPPFAALEALSQEEKLALFA